ALWDIQDRWGREQGFPPLLTHFGTSLVERALIEAACRKLGKPFHVALRENLFGIRLGEIHAALAGRTVAELLPARPLKLIGVRDNLANALWRDWSIPERPLTHIAPRHTIGLLDPLREADIPFEERLDDGLPQSLEESIRSYRLAL